MISALPRGADALANITGQSHLTQLPMTFAASEKQPAHVRAALKMGAVLQVQYGPHSHWIALEQGMETGSPQYSYGDPLPPRQPRL